MQLVLAIAILMQDVDPVDKFKADLDKRMKEYPTFTTGAMADVIRFTFGSAAKGGVPVLDAGAETVSKAVLALATRPTELRRAVGYIDKARKRAAEAGTDDEKRAALRYGLQRAFALYQNEAGIATDLFNLGIEFFAEASYAEAEDALKEVDERFAGLRLANINDTAEALRLSPIFLARIEMARGNYKNAAEALRRGLDRSPDWGDKDDLDLSRLTQKEGEYARMLKALDDHLAGHDDDVDALLLRAHEAYFSADRKKSAVLFAALLKKEPTNKYALYFADRLPRD
jgi:tetratricopeptide (TPR) repeat protein